MWRITIVSCIRLMPVANMLDRANIQKNREAFPKAVASTFDGIGIDRNTRVIIYEKENFEGRILLDVRGPKIVNNGMWENDPRCQHCNTDIFPDPELQKNFPIDVRIWTDMNMQTWS
eukprot:890568_1